jgi:hypothetical protein
MKNLSFLTLAIGMSAVMFLNSCEPTATVTPPLVTVNPTTELSAKPGDTLSYQMLINSDTELKSAEITGKFNSTVLFTTDSVFPAGADLYCIKHRTNYGNPVSERYQPSRRDIHLYRCDHG